MPSGAVRLPGAPAVTAAGAGVVTAEPSWMAERRRRGNPSGVGPAQRRWPWPWPWPSRMSGRRTRHWSPVRVRCPPGGRLSTGSGGRPVSTRPVSTRPARSWCPDGHASGDRGPGVRAVRTALDPGMRRCGGAAHVWARRVRYVAVVGEWLGRRCPELGSGREGMVVGSAVPGSDRVDGRPAACMDPRRLRRRARRRADMGAVQRRVPVGWWGHEQEQLLTRRPAGASWTGCRCDGRLGREMLITLRGRCAGVVRLRRSHSVR
jgi:hypothetical protein